MENHGLIASVMIIYLSLLILWGVYQGRKVKTGRDFAIAGRKLPGWAAALSERATGESSWALLGLPGAAYAMGLTEIWTAAGCVAGIITAWALLAWRLRDEAEKYNVSTFTEYISAKHGDYGKIIRIVSSLAIVFFFFFYVGAQFLGGGKTLHTLFGIKPLSGVLITAGIIIPYTIYGGFRSVVYTDVIQAVIMIITLVVAPVAGVIYLLDNPGLFATGIGEALVRSGDSYVSLTGAAKGFGAGILITGGFSWFFGYLGGQPQLSVRFMAVRDPKQAKKARNIGIAWTIIAYVGALMIGWIGIAIFGPAGLSDPEYVMPSVVMKLFHPVIAALLITGAIAAMISTADSLLILSATELSENIFKRQKETGDQEEGSLKRHRITTAAIAVVALALSYISPSKLIFTIVSYVWAGIGCTFSVVILFSLFCRRYHGLAAVITIISGIVFTIFWISGGFEQHYRVTEDKTQFLISQNIIGSDQATRLVSLEGKKFVSSSKFESALKQHLDAPGEKSLPVITTAYTRKGVPARLTTFLFALLAAIVSTFLIAPRSPSRP
ncbi:MAG: sodium/proline symporter [Bacteroidales bacterium]|nr:sodium/proline symporter [Bacteroidales bacterium]MBN2634128.1 sodium/proline symporter [Bacteroidales bacterium]